MQEAWAELIALIRTEMEEGQPIRGCEGQALARRGRTLLSQSTGGDPGIHQAMKTLWKNRATTSPLSWVEV